MPKKCFFTITLLAIVFSLALALFAQETSVKGNLAGLVTDSTGAVITDANVAASGAFGTKTTTSDKEGTFVFPLLVPGMYTVKIEKQGFQSAELKAVEVKTGVTSSIKVALKPGAVTEVVEVSATAVTVDTTTTAVSASLPDTFYQNVPVGRGVSSLFYLSPGVASSGESQYNPSISGGSALENLYVADGVGINDAGFNGIGVMTPLYGSLGTGINLSFIKEVQVKSGSFEPQYGNSTGGVIQIVTKSGGNEYHGAISGYFAPSQFQMPFAQRDILRTNKVGTIDGTANYEATGELGGYVPGFKNKLFFFASLDPSWQHDSWIAPVAAGIFDNGHVYINRTNVYNYAGKLTYKISDKHVVESSLYGDPAHTGTGLPYEPAPIGSEGGGTYNYTNNTGFSKWSFGTRNWVLRYNGTLSSSWLVNGSFTWNRNVFNESPSSDVFQVRNSTEIAGLPGQRGQFFLQGFGLLENHKADTYGYNLDTQKVLHALGTHTLSVGWSWLYPSYDQTKARSGGRFTVPTVNEAGGAYFICTPGQPCPIGRNTDSQWDLKLAPSTCTLCPLYPVNGFATPQRVYLTMRRGEFGAGGVIPTESKYMAGYINDSWSPERHVTFSAGIRWDQQHIQGTDVRYTFNDSWSPRIGIAVDPMADRKSKVYFNYARYSFGLPLDAAVRSLSSELDLLGVALAPVVSGSTVTVVPDAAHVLNLAPGGIASKPTITVAGGGEFMVPGTKWSYEDEFVLGGEHEFKNGMVISARYLDRRLKRIIEDMSAASPEGTLAGITVPSFIGNPSASLDVGTNEHSIVYPSGGAIPKACNNPGLVLDPAVDASGNPFPAPGDAICMAQVGTAAAGNAAGLPAGTPLYGGEVIADGKPDGFANAVRRYQAFELEVNKQFSRNWMMRSSLTVSKLYGNYLGAFRGDNGQIDPGISSLFDFTLGAYNLLGDQYRLGSLNTDRRYIANGFLSYTFDRYAVKGLTLGTGVRINSGTPISNFGNHPVYNNNGEVPVGGRGVLGRTPVNGQVDLHAEYPFRITEKSRLKIGADLFNITDSKTRLTIDQNNALGSQPVGSNLDFQTPLRFQNPFYARFSARWEF